MAKTQSSLTVVVQCIKRSAAITKRVYVCRRRDQRQHAAGCCGKVWPAAPRRPGFELRRAVIAFCACACNTVSKVQCRVPTRFIVVCRFWQGSHESCQVPMITKTKVQLDSGVPHTGTGRYIEIHAIVVPSFTRTLSFHNDHNGSERKRLIIKQQSDFRDFLKQR